MANDSGLKLHWTDVPLQQYTSVLEETRAFFEVTHGELCYAHAMPLSPSSYKELYELFAAVDSPKEAKMLLEDILTPQELESIAQRWQEIQALARGDSQRDIAKELKISISKITRGSRMLQYGGGGFRHFLRKLHK